MAITIKIAATTLSKDEAREIIYNTLNENYGSATWWDIAGMAVDRLHIIEIPREEP